MSRSWRDALSSGPGRTSLLRACRNDSLLHPVNPNPPPVSECIGSGATRVSSAHGQVLYSRGKDAVLLRRGRSPSLKPPPQSAPAVQLRVTPLAQSSGRGFGGGGFRAPACKRPPPPLRDAGSRTVEGAERLSKVAPGRLCRGGGAHVSKPRRTWPASPKVRSNLGTARIPRRHQQPLPLALFRKAVDQRLSKGNRRLPFVKTGGREADPTYFFF